MRIYAFVTHYPSAYKPYYDTQFLDLLRKGHDLNIFALGTLDRVVNPKVLEHGLPDRIRYFYPDDLRSFPKFVPQLLNGFIRAPARRIRTALRTADARLALKERLKHTARVLTLPTEAPDLCLVNGHWAMLLVPWLRSLYPGAPVALCYYGGEPSESGTLEDRLTRDAFSRADLVLTLTEYCREEAVRRGCPREITTVLPIGFALEDYRPPRPRRYRPGGVLRLISASRLSEGKGHIYALEALQQLTREGARDLHYTIIGDGPSRFQLETFVREHALEPYVTFAGTLTNQDVVEALGNADALVLSSVSVGSWTETQGAILQEALLMEALLITSESGGIPESIPPGMRDFSTSPNDADGLAAAIWRVHSLEESELRSLGEAGRRWATQRYDIRQLNQRMLEEALLTRMQAHGGEHGRTANAIAPQAVFPSSC